LYKTSPSVLTQLFCSAIDAILAVSLINGNHANNFCATILNIEPHIVLSTMTSLTSTTASITINSYEDIFLNIQFRKSMASCRPEERGDVSLNID
jgi:hypothetical protein